MLNQTAWHQQIHWRWVGGTGGAVIAVLVAVVLLFPSRRGAPTAATAASPGDSKPDPRAGSTTPATKLAGREPEADTRSARRLNGHAGAVLAVVFSRDGRRAFSGSADGTICCWDVASGTELRRLNVGPSVWEMAFSADGRRALCWRLENKLLPVPDLPQIWIDHVDVWDLEAQKKLSSLACGMVGSIAISPDGERVVVNTPKCRLNPDGMRDRPLQSLYTLWHADSGRRVYQSARPLSDRFSFTPDGRHVLMGGYEDTSLTLFDPAKETVIRRLGLPENYQVLTVAFAADGTRALTGSAEHGVSLWDVNSGRELRRFSGHPDRVMALAFAPDGRSFLSGGAGRIETQAGQVRRAHGDFTVRLWDAHSGKQLACFQEHTAPVTCVAFSPTGKHILSGAADGSLCLRQAPRR